MIPNSITLGELFDEARVQAIGGRVKLDGNSLMKRAEIEALRSAGVV